MNSIVCFGVMGMEPNQNNWWNGSMGRPINQPINHQQKANVFALLCWLMVDCFGWPPHKSTKLIWFAAAFAFLHCSFQRNFISFSFSIRKGPQCPSAFISINSSHSEEKNWIEIELLNGLRLITLISQCLISWIYFVHSHSQRKIQLLNIVPFPL